MSKRRKGAKRKERERMDALADHYVDGQELVAFKNWDVKCENCDEKPTVGDLGLCGPCCFGEAETLGGNW